MLTVLPTPRTARLPHPQEDQTRQIMLTELCQIILKVTHDSTTALDRNRFPENRHCAGSLPPYSRGRFPVCLTNPRGSIDLTKFWKRCAEWNPPTLTAWPSKSCLPCASAAPASSWQACPACGPETLLRCSGRP